MDRIAPRIGFFALLVATSVITSGQALAQTSRSTVDLGRQEYQAKCAVCHGLDGRGNGPMAGFMTKPVTDLSLLSRRNGGIFPINRAFDSITGDGVPSHGTRDMPIWGKQYRMDAADHYMDVPYDPEAYVRLRVLAVVEYLSRIQLK